MRPTIISRSTGNDIEERDYLLLSASLAATSEAVPEIVRAGLPRRAHQYTGAGRDGGKGEPSASDHCPIVVEIRL